MLDKATGRIPALIAAAAWLAVAAALLPSGTASAAARLPRFGHVLIVIMENKNYNGIIGRPDEARYINSLASGGALFSNSFAVAHPSQPNYLGLLSGSTLGVTNDNCPRNFKNVPNLGAELIKARLRFAGYSESMPSAGYTGCRHGLIGSAPRHNPWADFSNVPPASNLPFAIWPGDYRRLATVSFIVPNLCNDIH